MDSESTRIEIEHDIERLVVLSSSPYRHSTLLDVVWSTSRVARSWADEERVQTLAEGWS